LRIRFKGSHLNDDDGDFQREAGLNHSLDGTDGKGSDSYNYSSETANWRYKGMREGVENLRNIRTAAIVIA
jgi:hypothetical protein